MLKLALILIPVLTLQGCPDPNTGKIDPYLTARTIILQANTSLALADGIFNQWLLSQSDADKAKKTQEVFEKARTVVANSLQLALNGVTIAETAKTNPNMADLMKEANAAWVNLRKLLEDLFVSPPDAAQPVPRVIAKNEVPVASPVDNLPRQLYPLTK